MWGQMGLPGQDKQARWVHVQTVTMHKLTNGTRVQIPMPAVLWLLIVV